MVLIKKEAKNLIEEQGEHVIIPKSVTKIEKGAFFNCPKLTIQAPAGSAAEKYAKDKGISFVASEG